MRLNGRLNKFDDPVLSPIPIFVFLWFLDKPTVATVWWGHQLNTRVRMNSRNVKRIDGNKEVVLRGNN